LPTESDFTDIRFDASNSIERQQGNLGVSGNSRFSQDKEGDPLRLMEQTRASVNAHADLNASYGLFQPVATIGSHPFLRDELSNPTEIEAGNESPFADAKLPKEG
jgi:hypothetical protein